MSRINSRRPELVARGHVDPRIYGCGMHRTNLYLTRELFDRIRGMAVDGGLSFSAIVRELICDGLVARDLNSPTSFPHRLRTEVK